MSDSETTTTYKTLDVVLETQTKTTTTTIEHHRGSSSIFAEKEPSLLVTDGLAKAIKDCQERVARIAKECRVKNRKFRDIEFDLENDQSRCLHPVFPQEGAAEPADVHRVHQIFDNPRFYVDGASSGDIVQGMLGDCWFLSALATVSTCPGLIEKTCVARDEKVGIYGFIFFRDNRWVSVVIDDQLYTQVPKYEELAKADQELYHFDKAIYNKTARKGAKTLFFAKCGDVEETWVPLIEKAYAKLHGSYGALVGGDEGEGIEDLTGGVSTSFESKDILDIDLFWETELRRANKDRIFGCSFPSLDSTRTGIHNARVQGLVGSHAYSVLRAVEVRGKRFVVVRNPWGTSEWTGRWSDGSKEWTLEWLEILPELGHEFGEDGQFVMEYKDWLDAFSHIWRAILFDENWRMASQWLKVDVAPLPSAWSFGDVSFKFTISSPTQAVIVLSQLGRRHFYQISGKVYWTMDFVLVKEGESVPLAPSLHSTFFQRSVSLEIELEEGTYLVYVRLDRDYGKNSDLKQVKEDQLRKLSRLLTQRATGRTVAKNLTPEERSAYLPTQLESLIEADLQAFQKKQKELAGVITSTTEVTEDQDDDGVLTTTTTTTTTKIETIVQKATKSETPKDPEPTDSVKPIVNGAHDVQGETFLTYGDVVKTKEDAAKDEVLLDLPEDSPNTVYLGLRVYTGKDVLTTVTGRLKGDK